MQNSEYKQRFAISQSAIKAFKTKTIQKFKKIYIDGEENDEDGSKYTFGSLVDTLAYEPNLIDKRFFISNDSTNLPSDKIKQIIDNAYKEVKEIIKNSTLLNEKGNLPEPIFIPDCRDIYGWLEQILKAAKELKYGGTTWSNQRIIDNICNEGFSYFSLLGQCQDRLIISSYDNADAVESVNNLKSNEQTRPYFVQQENELLLFQVEIFTNYFIDDFLIALKGALDTIRIKKNDKTVQTSDLKTSYTSENFEYLAIKFDYVTQQSFYNFLLREWLKTFEGGAYADYTILPPINIVIDREFKIPYIYQYNWNDIEISRSGSVRLDVKGWEEYLKEIAWHIKTGVWDRPMELYLNGKIMLNIFRK
ncbi:MAG TPA: hypothetical protein VIQ04_03815 [Nitrososphaeraceae archaeon]